MKKRMIAEQRCVTQIHALTRHLIAPTQGRNVVCRVTVTLVQLNKETKKQNCVFCVCFICCLQFEKRTFY